MARNVQIELHLDAEPMRRKIQEVQQAMPELLTLEEAARYLRQPVKTLRNWRSEGRGPASMKLGRRVLYDKTDLDAWVERQKRNGAP